MDISIHSIKFWCCPFGVLIRNVLFSHHLLFVVSLVRIQEQTTVMLCEVLLTGKKPRRFRPVMFALSY